MISLCQERFATLGFDVTDLKIDDWKKVALFPSGSANPPEHHERRGAATYASGCELRCRSLLD